MQKTKRIIVATVSGILFGLVCFGLASSGPDPLPAAVGFQIVISRALIGFAIGISCLSAIHWSLHGTMMGLLFSLPLAIGGLLAPENPEFSKMSMLVWTVIFGMIYGLLTEVITSKLFKAKIEE